MDSHKNINLYCNCSIGIKSLHSLNSLFICYTALMCSLSFCSPSSYEQTIGTGPCEHVPLLSFDIVQIVKDPTCQTKTLHKDVIYSNRSRTKFYQNETEFFVLTWSCLRQMGSRCCECSCSPPQSREYQSDASYFLDFSARAIEGWRLLWLHALSFLVVFFPLPSKYHLKGYQYYSLYCSFNCSNFNLNLGNCIILTKNLFSQNETAVIVHSIPSARTDFFGQNYFLVSL